MKNNKLVVILGPNASGKTSLSIKLAKRFHGEIVSADSRQVYKGMDIGTGKVTKKEMQGIPHYLLDVASPKKIFNVADYQKLANSAIKKIQEKGKLPFLVGGTGFYIQSVVDNISLPEVKPDWKLRKQLEKKSVEELFKILKKLDPNRAKNIDKKNPRRLIRAIEIAKKIGKVPVLEQKPEYEVLIIGVKRRRKELKKLIEKRLLARFKREIIKEVEKLHKNGVSWKRLEEFGLEYRYIAFYLQKKMLYDEMVQKLQKEIEHYAKRQMTWFSAHGGSASGGKRYKKINWTNDYKKAEKLVQKFKFIFK